jgi:hypothetical protein
MAIKVSIEGVGNGTCSLTGKEGDGLTCSFEDGTVRGQFRSWKAFRQILVMKAGQGGRPEQKPRREAEAPETVPANGEA